MSILLVLIVFVLVVIIMLGYRYLKETNLNGLVAAMLPLAVLPVLIAWLLSITQFMRGFQAFTTEEEAGFTKVAEVILASDRLAKAGQSASLVVLVVLFLLGIWLLFRKPSTPTPMASRLRSFVLMALATLCMLVSVVSVELGTTTIALPLAVAAPLPESYQFYLSSDEAMKELWDDPNIPMTRKAKDILDLDNENTSINSVAETISVRMVISSIVPFLSIFLCTSFFIVGFLLMRSSSFSRTFLILSLLVTNLAAIAGGRQLLHHKALEAEVFYLLERAATLSETVSEEGTDNKNKAEDAKWYRMAAEQGDAGAQFNLGLMYGNGQGVPRDFAEAMKWWRKAAEQGLAIAQYYLGMAYANGEGVTQDYISAYMWYDIAPSNGYKPATEKRDDLAKEMTSDDIEEAKERAQTCLESNYTQCD